MEIRNKVFMACVVVLCSSSFLLADHHETATAAEFEELGDKLAGRWIDDVTLIADWPGPKKEARRQARCVYDFSLGR